MSYELIVQDEAWMDMEAAHDYYEEQRLGLGKEFIEEIEDCFTLISQHPERYGYYSGSDRYRRILAFRFPYRVIFEIEGSKIFVAWVTHTSKDKRLD